MNTPPSDDLIRCEQLTRAYRMGEVTVHALQGLDLRVGAGTFAVLLGPSGSGKTTTLNLIGGLDRPTGGRVIVQGEEISLYDETQLTRYRQRKVGFVFQFFNLIPTLSVLENVTLPQELAGRDRRTVEAAAMTLLDRVGLADRHDAFPDKLSGGEQQRVAIARALAHDPLLVLADEPTGNLDDENGRRVLALLLELTRDAGRTLLMATHNPDIAPLADRVLELHDGQLRAG